MATWHANPAVPKQVCCLTAKEREDTLTLPVLHQVPVTEHAVENTLALRLQDMDEGDEGAQPLFSIQHGMQSAARHMFSSTRLTYMSPVAASRFTLHCHLTHNM